MNRLFSISILTTILVFMPMKQSLAGSDPFIGEISIFSGNYAPKGYMLCRGQVLNIVDHMSLYAVLGVTYGGDGRSTFALPNLEEAEKSLGSFMANPKYIIAVDGIFPPRP